MIVLSLFDDNIHFHIIHYFIWLNTASFDKFDLDKIGESDVGWVPEHTRCERESL